MVRIGALDMLANVPPGGSSGHSSAPLLSDPIRGVRIRVVSLLAPVPTASQPPGDREPFERAAAELVDPIASMPIGQNRARRLVHSLPSAVSLPMLRPNTKLRFG